MAERVLEEALRTLEVLVCVGPGGVGKTTVSASLALQSAIAGREAMVCTIDPARRLANALGLEEFGNVEMTIPEKVWSGADLTPGAPLHAMMLDMKRSWDDLISRSASEELRERIFANRFYQALSTVLAGSQEYIAMEKLWELRNDRDYPLIVLDTPPTAHALDFLDAPDRLLGFMGNDTARFFLNPAAKAGRFGMKIASLGTGFVLKQLSRVAGGQTLEELGAFLSALSSLNEGFSERARGVKALLRDEKTGFVLVTTPAPERLNEVIHFHDLLVQSDMRPVAIVVNRVHQAPDEELSLQAAALDGKLREHVESTIAEARLLAERDLQGIRRLQQDVKTPLVIVPRLANDVHDLRGLAEAAGYLLAPARR